MGSAGGTALALSIIQNILVLGILREYSLSGRDRRDGKPAAAFHRPNTFSYSAESLSPVAYRKIFKRLPRIFPAGPKSLVHFRATLGFSDDRQRIFNPRIRPLSVAGKNNIFAQKGPF